jgi:heme/copper-type cytochrome/quinol oxidase subunit 2
VLAFLVGVGAAAAISGALLGTIFPLVDQSTRELADKDLSYIILYSGFILVGTISTLVYFHYGAHPTPSGATRRSVPIEIVSLVGQVFIVVTLAAIFAGVYLAVLPALIERIFSILNFDWKNFFSLFS